MMTATTHTEPRRPLELGEGHVCICAGYGETELLTAIERHELTTVNQVMNATGAGTGCFGCWEDIDRLIARVREVPRRPQPLTDRSRRRLVRTVVDDEIRPALRRHGGDIAFRELRGPRVHVRLTGALPEERIDGFTHHDLAEALLQELVDEELILEAEG